MSPWIWLAVALPLMAALAALFGLAKGKLARCLAKGGATWVALMSAVVGQETGGNLPVGEWIVAALAVFVAADVLLEINLPLGMAAFLAGHGALIYWIWEQGLVSWASVPIAVVLYALALALFRGRLAKAGKLLIPMLIYPAALMAMAGMAVVLPVLGGMDYLPFALGAALFVVSDLLVAANMLGGVERKWRVLAMALYYAAVLLMSLSCWMLF